MVQQQKKNTIVPSTVHSNGTTVNDMVQCSYLDCRCFRFRKWFATPVENISRIFRRTFFSILTPSITKKKMMYKYFWQKNTF